MFLHKSESHPSNGQKGKNKGTEELGQIKGDTSRENSEPSSSVLENQNRTGWLFSCGLAVCEQKASLLRGFITYSFPMKLFYIPGISYIPGYSFQLSIIL